MRELTNDFVNSCGARDYNINSLTIGTTTDTILDDDIFLNVLFTNFYPVLEFECISAFCKGSLNYWLPNEQDLLRTYPSPTPEFQI